MISGAAPDDDLAGTVCSGGAGEYCRMDKRLVYGNRGVCNLLPHLLLCVDAHPSLAGLGLFILAAGAGHFDGRTAPRRAAKRIGNQWRRSGAHRGNDRRTHVADDG